MINQQSVSRASFSLSCSYCFSNNWGECSWPFCKASGRTDPRDFRHTSKFLTAVNKKLYYNVFTLGCIYSSKYILLWSQWEMSSCCVSPQGHEALPRSHSVFSAVCFPRWCAASALCPQQAPNIPWRERLCSCTVPYGAECFNTAWQSECFRLVSETIRIDASLLNLMIKQLLLPAELFFWRGESLAPDETWDRGLLIVDAHKHPLSGERDWIAV